MRQRSSGWTRNIRYFIKEKARSGGHQLTGGPNLTTNWFRQRKDAIFHEHGIYTGPWNSVNRKVFRLDKVCSLDIHSGMENTLTAEEVKRAVSMVALTVARDGHNIENKLTISAWRKEISGVSPYEAGMLAAFEELGLGDLILE